MIRTWFRYAWRAAVFVPVTLPIVLVGSFLPVNSLAQTWCLETEEWLIGARWPRHPKHPRRFYR